MKTAETKTFSPEIQATSTLRQAGSVLREVAGWVDESLIEEGIDLDSIPPGQYWMKVSEAANRLVRQEYSTPETLSLAKAIELTAATPVGAMNALKLRNAENSGNNIPKDEFQQNLYYTCYYQNLLLEYVQSNPGITAPELNNHLTTVLDKTIDAPAERYRRVLAEHISGAQHEIAAGQLLRTIGNTRPSTIEEELQGIDYILEDSDSFNAGIPINIKASEAQVHTKTHQKSLPFGIARSGIMITRSFVRDEDLNGKFYLEEEKVTRLAPMMRSAVEACKSSSSLRRVRYAIE